MTPKTEKIEVDGRLYAFPAGISVMKIDQWQSYDKLKGLGLSCVDFAVIHHQTLYLIEVKDYDHPATQQPGNLDEIVITKTLGALGVLGLLRQADVSSLSHSIVKEADFAKNAFNCKNLVVVTDIFTSTLARKVKRNPRPRNLEPKPKAIQKKIQSRMSKLGIQTQVHLNGAQSRGGVQPFWSSTLNQAERDRRLL